MIDLILFDYNELTELSWPMRSGEMRCDAQAGQAYDS